MTTAFLAFVATVGLADYVGPGHQWGGLALLTGWFFVCRALGPRAWRWLLAAALALSVAIAALAVAQFGSQLTANWQPIRARGPFASPNFLGAYAVLMFFLGYEPAGGRASEPLPTNGSCLLTWLWATSRIAPLISLALSQSRGALLALGAGLCVSHFGRKICIFYAGAAVAAVLLIRPGVDEARWMIWWLGWQAAMQRPLTGWGQGGLVIGGLDRFYSIPLEVFVAGGLLGIAAGAGLLYAAARAAWTSPTLLAFLAAWFAQGLFLFSIPATNILFVTVLAYLASVDRDKAHDASRAHNDHPTLDGGVRAGRAE